MAIKVLAGFGLTFSLTIACFLTAVLVAVFTCAGFLSKNGVIRTVVKVYNGIMIKIPPLVMLMLFALILTGDKNTGSLLIAYVGLSLFVAANLAGVFHGGFCSVAKGEIEVARTFGMSKRQTFFHIMLPQILGNIAPVCMSMFVMCVQITSVASVIGVQEFLGVAGSIENDVVSILIAVTGYFVIGTIGDFAITRMGKRKHINSKEYLGKGEVR